MEYGICVSFEGNANLNTALPHYIIACAFISAVLQSLSAPNMDACLWIDRDESPLSAAHSCPKAPCMLSARDNTV